MNGLGGIDWKAEAVRVHEGVAKIKGRPPWDDDDRRFLANALGGEIGELANLVKKGWRGDEGDRAAAIREEAADCRIYLQLLAAAHAVDLDAYDRIVVAFPADAKTVAQQSRYLSLQLEGAAGTICQIAGNIWLDALLDTDVAKRAREMTMHRLRGQLDEFSRVHGFDLDGACRAQLPKIWARWPQTAPDANAVRVQSKA